MDGARNYHPEGGNPITKEHTRYAITDKWILAQKLGIPKIQLADHMKLKKKEDQSFLCGCFGSSEKGNKIVTGANMVTKHRAETEGKAIQRLSHLVIHA